MPTNKQFQTAYMKTLIQLGFYSNYNIHAEQNANIVYHTFSESKNLPVECKRFLQCWRVFVPKIQRAKLVHITVNESGSLFGLKKLLKKYSGRSHKKNIVPPVIGFIYEQAI